MSDNQAVGFTETNGGDWYTTYENLGYEATDENVNGSNAFFQPNQTIIKQESVVVHQTHDVPYNEVEEDSEGFIFTDCVEGAIGERVEDLDNDLSKHNLVLKEIITEQGLIRESYFCQECSVEYSDINEFLHEHPGTQLLENPEEECSEMSTIMEPVEETIEENQVLVLNERDVGSQHDKLWDLVENIIEEDHNDDNELSDLIPLNNKTEEGEDLGPSVKTKTEIVDTEREHYFCYECRQLFTDLNTAEEHDCGAPNAGTTEEQMAEPEEEQQDEAAEEEDYSCAYCQQMHSSYEDMMNHISVCELNETVPLTTKPAAHHCEICNKDYLSLRSYYNHQRLHKKMKIVAPQGPAKCEICNTLFQSVKNLKLHMKMHNERSLKSIQEALPAGALTEYSELNQFYCEICNKSFDQRLLAIHKNMHQNVEEYNCSKCNKQFDNSTNYDMHMQMHNETRGNSIKHTIAPDLDFFGNASGDVNRKKHSCQYCGKEFQRPYEKVKHERIHTGEKPYNCEVCGKTFRVSYSLTLHLRTHTDIRPYVCATCNKRFKQQSVYVHHLKTHVAERQYRCEECGKSFRTSVQLCGHRNSHKKPFNCTECNRPFASMYAVKIHMKTHNKGNKANKNLKNRCDLCGASYARIFALRFHLKEQHGVEVEPAQLLDAEHSSFTGKDMDVETAILMNAANEAQLGDEHNGEMSFMNADDEEGEADSNNETSQIDHSNGAALLNHDDDLDETVAATQTILQREDIIVDNFHAEEVITDWLK